MSSEENAVDEPEVTASASKTRVKAKSRKPKRTKRLAAADKKSRRTPLFPAVSFEEALGLALAIQRHAAGRKVRRLTLFNQMGKSPDSGPSRQLIINSNRYGLTRGSYKAEHLELSPEGALATSAEMLPCEKLKARFTLAVERITPFKALYDAQVGNRLPATSVLEDVATEHGIPKEDAKECVEIFIVNAKFIGVLKVIAGAERIIPLDQAIEELPGVSPAEPNAPAPPQTLESKYISRTLSTEKVGEHDFAAICFYISPIGDDASEHRQHSDLFLGSIVEPALEEFGLKVVRADKIGKPGMITGQIIEHIVKAKLVIADLSYHNPNVFYELCLRHACRLPTVQLIRKLDKIPFDLDQFRTIQIDTTSIFTMIPNLQVYKAEIATQVRMALKDPDSADNPISTFYPNLRIGF